ncbi:hypothetical protein [Listeria booriae]|uniref:hypothetical protein n=1 Tax=Listeria booriae TaxID=1552123 RepID=UPI00162A8D9B|nr:hypothetical protein [Listeria booriae]MBC1524442.1 hypothetical protein [Listeria booriae]MBC6306420.1 hypothetical protein [Listeria booriae]
MSASDFLPYKELKLSSGVYKLRLSRFRQEALERDFGINAKAFFRNAVSNGEIDETEMGAVIWSMLNTNGQVISVEQTGDILDLAVRELGQDEVQKLFLSALSAAFMTEEQHQKYEELVNIIEKAAEEDGDVKKSLVSNEITEQQLLTLVSRILPSGI